MNVKEKSKIYLFYGLLQNNLTIMKQITNNYLVARVKATPHRDQMMKTISATHYSYLNSWYKNNKFCKLFIILWVGSYYWIFKCSLYRLQYIV